MLDQVAYLSGQAAAAAKDRQPGVIRLICEALTQAAGAASAIAGAWNNTAPILRNYFGF
jgi:hypothetical protein